jgi:hypothetical protein
MRAFDTVAMLALRALLTIYERQQWSEWKSPKQRSVVCVVQCEKEPPESLKSRKIRVRGL